MTYILQKYLSQHKQLQQQLHKLSKSPNNTILHSSVDIQAALLLISSSHQSPQDHNPSLIYSQKEQIPFHHPLSSLFRIFTKAFSLTTSITDPLSSQKQVKIQTFEYYSHFPLRNSSTLAYLSRDTIFLSSPTSDNIISRSMHT